MTADGRRPACPAFCRSGFCAAPLAPRLPQAHLVLVLLSCSVAHASAGTEEPERELEHVVERPAVAVAYPMLWLFVVLTMGCLVKLLLQKLKEKKNIGIPYSVVLLSLGMFLGALTWTEEASSALPDGEGARERRWHSDSDIWTLSLSSWTEMDPRLILFIFLPALIFEGAASTDYYVFRRQLPGGMLLAFPGMIAQVVLIAVFAIYGFPYGWGWTESLLFGSILSATDPVAVIALMKELGLLSDLRVLIEAESLLNDGAAIVVFELCHMILVHPASTHVYVSKAFQFVLGAPALGLALFLASWYWLVRDS